MKSIKLFIAIILVLPFFLIVQDTAQANGATYEVSSSILHVREEPAANSTIIGLLKKGDKVTIFQEKYGWAQTYYAGKVAWIAKHHLIATNTTTKQPTPVSQVSGNEVTITASSVHVRSGPGVNYTSIGGTTAGKNFTVVDRSGDWLKISLAKGKTGWIAAWLTTDAKQKTATTPAASVPVKSSNNSLAGINIVIDAGHGGRDSGAIGIDGVYEKDIVVNTARQIANTLRAYGATVIETRTADYFLALDERIDISNAYNTHAFISVHYNAFPVMSVSGLNTFYTGINGRELAQNVHNSLATSLPLNNRGMVPANYKVLQQTNAPAILLELGFLTNPYDMSVIRTAGHEQQVAEAVANGLLNYFD
ncbi:N-acetylmuramoyl-L-alanine amidase [Oceanobacillus sp. CAU 1775]